MKHLQLVAALKLTSITAQETVVNDLTARLARIEPSTRSGKASIIDFCSRESLEEEKRVFDREVTRLKSAAREKDAVVAKKDEKITELEQRGLFLFSQDEMYSRSAQFD